MTVNEAIKALKKLRKNGHGETEIKIDVPANPNRIQWKSAEPVILFQLYEGRGSSYPIIIINP